MKVTTRKVCSGCYGGNVFYDAWVNVNDPTDVRSFDAVFCEDCDGETSLIDFDEEALAAAKWVIIGNPDDDTDWVFWSNEDGWVDKASATRFTLDERKAFVLLPDGAYGWVAVPE
jgi:hypothetical protein